MKLSAVSGLVRGSNWWYSKIPPLLAVAYAEIALQRLGPGVALSRIAALLVSACCVAAYGHVLNDICDIETDRLAGKTNAMARLTRTQRAALCLGLAAAGLAPWLFTGLDRASALLLVCLYALPVIYNVPPVRLKEHGFWGVLADAAQAHLAPTLFVMAAFSGLTTHMDLASAAFAALAAAWALFRGLRDIMRHQLWDKAADAAGGVSTFVAGRSPEQIRLFINRVCFPVEALTLGGLALVIWTFSPWACCVFAAYAALFGIARIAGAWTPPFDPGAPTPPASWTSPGDGRYVPLNEFYRVWPSLVLAASLVTQDFRHLVVLALHVAFFHSAITKQARDLFQLVAQLLRSLATWMRRGLATVAARKR